MTDIQKQVDTIGAEVTIRDVAGRDDVERFQTAVRLPPSFMYVIPGRKKSGRDWVDDNKVGITSDGYDYINRVLGASFFLPDTVPDNDGRLANNPIHRSNYIYARMGAVWYNEVGQLVATTEDLEIDFGFTYQSARLDAYDSEVVLDNAKQPMFDAAGHPKIELKNQGDEKKALKTLTQLRTMGMRYAQTVLRTRLLKVATGIKSLPLQAPAPFDLRIVGYRDRMTPLERQKKAEDSLDALYAGGRPADVIPLSDTEFADIEGHDADDRAAATVAVATGTATVEQLDQQSLADQAPAQAPAQAGPMSDAEKFEAMQSEWDAQQGQS